MPRKPRVFPRDHVPKANARGVTFAKSNPRHDALRSSHRLHCGDATQWDFSQHTWTTYLQRSEEKDAPPLRVVIEDASHLSQHMVIAVFFFGSPVAPGGIRIIEAIESQSSSNRFRTDLVQDVHYCGLPSEQEGTDQVRFPTLQPLLQAMHCEFNICVLQRNNKPAVEHNQTMSAPPRHALDFIGSRKLMHDKKKKNC